MTGAAEAKASRSRPSRGELLAVAGVVVVLAVLWSRGMDTGFWADEGISTGVASRSLWSIPRVVTEESSPPLYYMVLHVWGVVVGWSDTATHGLSMLFALAAVPVAMWAGWTLFGRRAAWFAVAITGISPFLAAYANETRMYSLAALLSLVTVTAFTHVFVFRRRRLLPVFVAALALLLYTHNWGLLLGAAAGVALLPLLLAQADRRRFALDALLGFGAVSLLYAPWVPSLVTQVRADLQPWGTKATPAILRDELVHLFGGREMFILLAVGAGVGIAALAEDRRITLEKTAIVALAAVPALVMVLGWRTSVWTHRYLAVVLGALVLVLAGGMARGGRVATAALGVAVVLGAPIGVGGPPHHKSNARAAVAAAASVLRPGDLVVVPDPHMLPLIAHYMPNGMRYASATGEVSDERLVEWTNFTDRLDRARASVAIAPLIESLPRGSRIAVFCPDSGGADDGRVDPAGPDFDAPLPSRPGDRFNALRLRVCNDTLALLARTPGLRHEVRSRAPDGVQLTPVDARVLTKL